ncbi:hypothetical protein AC579_1796 [Pseudocercospora musae]|uniref:AAA+ ATPase domain-containing protein n=1 Tax=Pseudocercospora musae TaxID=113226 RepID=A0A139I0Q5_9PEZI|nr:hypothetical protein AC579_1796 [Pseudocercospora musae]
MADLAATIVSFVDISIRLVKFIHETKKGADAVDDDLLQLGREVQRVADHSEDIRTVFQKDFVENGKAKENDTTANIWQRVSSILKDSQYILIKMESKLKEIKGEDGSSTYDRVRRHFRKLSKESDFLNLRQGLDKNDQLLQMSLTTLSIIVTKKEQAGQSKSIANLSSKMSLSSSRLEQLILSLEATVSSSGLSVHEKDSLEAAKSIQKVAWVNAHFMIPQAVSNIFMGREKDLTDMQQALAEFEKEGGTKRIVIYGLNGAGKTQFCCKFAQENRDRFWAVFSIDAASSETIQQSYADIAQRVDIEPKETNVKYWLSAQTKPWLLIVDNVDEHLQSHKPEDFIPEAAEFGLVLFTTRNQSLQMYGDGKPFRFEGLEEERSTALLLRIAYGPRAPDSRWLPTARKICHELGNLPLAILHAGKAILQGNCTLDNCLDSIKNSLTQVHSRIIGDRAKRARSFSGVQSQLLDEQVTITNAKVYATFELVIPTVSQNASELLRLLSFMSSQRFHFNILLSAIVNPQRQADSDREAARKSKSVHSRPKAWDQHLKSALRNIYLFLERLGTQSMLPEVFRALATADRKVAEYTLRGLLVQLRERALIEWVQEPDDTYCIHSSVKWWIQASMPYQERAVWCEAASNVLTLAILLPPVGVTADDAKLRRQVLVHVKTVKKSEIELRKQLVERQRKRESWRFWPILGTSMSRAEVLRIAKYSLVHAEGGEFRESQKLMAKVDKFLVGAIGLGDPISAKARLFLAETHWWLSEANQAVRLQEELLAACAASLGEDDAETLNVRSRLGLSFWQQGEYAKGREYSEQALKGLENIYDTAHVDKSRAMSNLGLCHGKLANFGRAVRLHSEAFEGLLQAQREQDEKYEDQILDAMQNLAMAKHDRYRYGDADDKDLYEAGRLQADVFKKFEEQHNKEHPKTLWAACNLARIKALMGHVSEAEQMIASRLPIADRTLGEEHIGTLMGKAYYGQILTLAGKLDAAEKVLRSVVAAHRARDEQEMHGDHLVAAAFLLDCYRKQGKTGPAEKVEVEVTRGIRHIFGDGSSWEEFFVGHYSGETMGGAERGDVENRGN